MSVKLNPPAVQRPPITITITGSCGSGKSSLTAFIAFALEEHGVMDITVRDIEVRTESDLWDKRTVVVENPQVIGPVTIETLQASRSAVAR